MGYAKQGQNTKGIHIRQFSRAFIFEQDGERNVYVSADCGMMGQLVKMKVSYFNLHIHKFSIGEHSYMTSDDFWAFLTYLPTLIRYFNT